MCSVRTDGQIDMTKLIVTFRNFANAPKDCNDRSGLRVGAPLNSFLHWPQLHLAPWPNHPNWSDEVQITKLLNFTFCWPCIVLWFLVTDQRDAQFLIMYLFLYLTLYMFRAHHAYHQERQIVSIQPLVTVTLYRWPCRVQVGNSLPSCTRHGYRQ
jgi:hypothetical protein